MNFYKFSKTSIFLITGVLLACSPNKQQSATNKTSPEKVLSTSNTNQATTGMKVYIDPKTGKFLDTPPEDTSATKNKTVVNNVNLNSSQDQKPSYKEKDSTVPGGGVFIEMPAP